MRASTWLDWLRNGMTRANDGTEWEGDNFFHSRPEIFPQELPVDPPNVHLGGASSTHGDRPDMQESHVFVAAATDPAPYYEGWLESKGWRFLTTTAQSPSSAGVWARSDPTGGTWRAVLVVREVNVDPRVFLVDIFAWWDPPGKYERRLRNLSGDG